MGYKGVLTVDAFNKFMETIITLSKANPEFNFLYKSKKSLAQISLSAGNKSIELIEKIKFNNNTFYVNDYSINQFQLMAISNLVISAPMSSVFYESLAGGIRSISYDPCGQYKNYNVPSVQFEKMYASTYKRLEELIEYWLTESTDYSFQEYLSNQVYPHLDDKCNGTAINQFKGLLALDNREK